MVSIIIPALNEAAALPALLQALDALSGDREVLVADGGSHDATRDVARAASARLVTAPRGRARQMNAGAEAARGDVLWFLHADSRPAPGALALIQRALARPETVGGCFRLQFDAPHPGLRLIAWGSHLRARHLGLVFGDQGLFVRRSAFRAAGGFPDIELMEDWALSRRLARVGRLAALSEPIVSSARRFTAGGVWTTFWLMQRIKRLYALGVPPGELRRIYERKRTRMR